MVLVFTEGMSLVFNWGSASVNMVLTGYGIHFDGNTVRRI